MFAGVPTVTVAALITKVADVPMIILLSSLTVLLSLVFLRLHLLTRLQIWGDDYPYYECSYYNPYFQGFECPYGYLYNQHY